MFPAINLSDGLNIVMVHIRDHVAKWGYCCLTVSCTLKEYFDINIHVELPYDVSEKYFSKYYIRIYRLLIIRT